MGCNIFEKTDRVITAPRITFVSGFVWFIHPYSSGMFHWPSYNRVTVWLMSSRWRHQMETFSALLALCEGNPLVDSPHKGQWRGALMFSLICVWTNDSANNRDAGDLRRHRAHYDVSEMIEVILKDMDYEQQQSITERELCTRLFRSTVCNIISTVATSRQTVI